VGNNKNTGLWMVLENLHNPIGCWWRNTFNFK